MWPSVESEEVGQEKIVDNVIDYNYELSTEGRNFKVKAVPFCREKSPKYRIVKKQHHGIVFIIVETPIFGLGLVDWALSYMVTKSSETRELIGYVPTGIKTECNGKITPLTGEIFIQDPSSLQMKSLEVGDNGKFFLGSVLGPYRGVKQYNLFIKVKGELNYLSSVWW